VQDLKYNSQGIYAATNDAMLDRYILSPDTCQDPAFLNQFKQRIARLVEATPRNLKRKIRYDRMLQMPDLEHPI